MYPYARRTHASYTLHGKIIEEPYEYLENPDLVETHNYVASQNAFFENHMSFSPAANILRDRVFQRMIATQNYPRANVVTMRRGKYCYFKNSGLQRQDVCVEVDSLSEDSEETVLLDLNVLSDDSNCFLQSSSWSADESMFAYGVSYHGSDWQHIRIMDVANKTVKADSIRWSRYAGTSWWGNYGIFYTRYGGDKSSIDSGVETESAENPSVFFHVVGTPQREDIFVMRVPDHPKWILGAEVCDSGKYLVISLFDGCEPFNLIWIGKLPESPKELRETLIVFNPLVNEFIAAYNYLGNDDNVFYFSTSRNAPNNKIISVNIDTLQEETVVKERKSVLAHAILAQNTVVLVYLEDVHSAMYYFTLGELDRPRFLPLPLGCVTCLRGDRKSSFVSLHMTSFTIPGRVYTFDVNNPEGTMSIFKDSVVNGLNPEDYIVEQKRYASVDGTSIPMFIIRHMDTQVDEQTPVLLYGFGGFNVSITPQFSPSRLVFLNNLRGVAVIANVRGGGEYGSYWHNSGRKANKQNCFSDFICAAKNLHLNKCGSPATTAIMGASNGGLLVAAVANQAPEVSKCVVCQAGVLDMLKFHKFTIGHAWKSDYGDPEVKEDFEILAAYSPIHNVSDSVTYPAILVVTGDRDDRVVPMHSLKYIATLQHANPLRGGPFLARIEMSSGHIDGKPTDMRVKEAADMYTFIAMNCGAEWHES